jgi:signal transduction histidine kinase
MCAPRRFRISLLFMRGAAAPGDAWRGGGSAANRNRALSILAISGVTGYVVGELAARARRRMRGAEWLARDVARIAEEQAALRRVATLVARAASPDEVFEAVTAEVGRLLGVDLASMIRYTPDGAAATWVGAWSSTGTALAVPVGARVELGGRNTATIVFQTGRPARIDDYADSTGPVADVTYAWGVRAAIGVPISVDGRLWGVMTASSTRAEPMPADYEARLAGFTELVATAIANAESQAQLTASRARIMAAADHARRRIERDLHDGAQQRLVALAMRVQAAQAAVPPEADELAAQLDDLAVEATSALDELRELARGIHPAILAEGGLPPAVTALARRCTIPVRLDLRAGRRLPEQIEIAAYYLVAEALTNAAKHAHASTVDVEIDTGEGDAGNVLRVWVRDDGRGGANLANGSGLVGLKDRVEALGGRFRVRAAPGKGTTVHAELPF